jgi:hypothetical protein
MDAYEATIATLADEIAENAIVISQIILIVNTSLIHSSGVHRGQYKRQCTKHGEWRRIVAAEYSDTEFEYTGMSAPERTGLVSWGLVITSAWLTSRTDEVPTVFCHY